MAAAVIVFKFIFLTLIQHASFEPINADRTKLKENDPVFGKQCTVTLHACSIKPGGFDSIGIHLKGERGEKGERGFLGPIGPPGLQGEKGVKGSPGLEGFTGQKGESGTKGEPGIKGEPGLAGPAGPVGPKGFPGFPGLHGKAGPEGPPGTPGLPGTCDCVCSTESSVMSKPSSSRDKSLHESDGSRVRKAYDVGSKFKPAISCKYIEKISDNGNWVNPNNKFEIICNKETNATCLKKKEIEMEPIYYQNKSKPFWISETGFDFTSLYFGYTMEQLRWLQQHSSSVTMKLTYHCLNSVAYRNKEGRLKDALNLLSWNDVVMTPYPTSSTPLFYGVDVENDGCKDSSHETKWLQTDIIVTSNIGNRLPTIDIYIVDVPKETTADGGSTKDGHSTDKAFRLEIKELCFG